MVTVKKFRAKAIVEAFQVDLNEEEIPDRIQYVAGNYYFNGSERLLHVQQGDWVVRDGDEYFVVSELMFKKLYEEIPDAN